jgi:hypothetical protein
MKRKRAANGYRVERLGKRLGNRLNGARGSNSGNQQSAETPVDDGKSRLQDLERQKTDLQKQLDSLQGEGRRAGAPAAWFR